VGVVYGRVEFGSLRGAMDWCGLYLDVKVISSHEGLK